MENNQSGVDGFLRSSKITRSPVNMPLSERDRRAINRQTVQNMVWEQNNRMLNNDARNHPLPSGKVNTMENPGMYDESSQTLQGNITEDVNDLIMLSGENAFSSTTIPLDYTHPIQPEVVYEHNKSVEQISTVANLTTKTTPPQNHQQSLATTILPLTEKNVSRVSGGSVRSNKSNASSRESRQAEYQQKLHELEKRRIDIEEKAMQRRLDEEERFLKAQFESLGVNKSQQSRVRKFTDRLNETWTYVQSLSDKTLTEYPDSFEFISSENSEENHNFRQQPTYSSHPSCQPSALPPLIQTRQQLTHLPQNISPVTVFPDAHPNRLLPQMPRTDPCVNYDHFQNLPTSTMPTLVPQRRVPNDCLPSSDLLQLHKKQRPMYAPPPSRINSTFISQPNVQQGRLVDFGTDSYPAQTFNQVPSQTIQPESTIPPLSSTLMPNITTNSVVNRSLTYEELAARHAFSKDLPRFSGSVDEWPLFIVNFNQSTSRCNFSNAENLIRLQKSLYGKALDSVRGFLMVPETVPMVMDTLQTLFGRPEQIIKSLQKKLRTDTSFKQERLDLLVQFALSLQNYCAIVSATGLETYLNDPILLDDLVLKLPPQTRLEWSVYSNSTTENNLVSFSKWLYNLAKCVSRVLPSPIVNPSDDRKSNRQGSAKNNVHQTLHLNETPKETPSREVKGETSQSPKCLMCEGEHKIERIMRKSRMNYATWRHIEERRAIKVRLDQSHSRVISNQLR